MNYYSLELNFPYFSYLTVVCLLIEHGFKVCFYWVLFVHVKIRQDICTRKQQLSQSCWKIYFPQMLLGELKMLGPFISLLCHQEQESVTCCSQTSVLAAAFSAFCPAPHLCISCSSAGQPQGQRYQRGKIHLTLHCFSIAQSLMTQQQPWKL